MLSLNKRSLGTTKKNAGFRDQTSDHHVLVEVPEEQTQNEITGEQSEGIMGRNVSTTTSVPVMLQLRKYILLLASVVAMVTYAAGFNAPGGVWKDTVAGHLAGDPIFRDSDMGGYLVFFYCNATAFAASLLVIVGIIIHNNSNSKNVWLLHSVMFVDLVCLTGPYINWTGRDKFTGISYLLVMAFVFAYIVHVYWMAVSLRFTESSGVLEAQQDELLQAEQRFRKILMVLATFAVSITYTAALSTPGGIWDTTEAGHRPGDAILKDSSLIVFFGFNATAFAASLLLIVVLLDSRLRKKHAYMFILLTLISLFWAYVAGSYKKTVTAGYLMTLVAAIPVYITFLLLLACATEAIWKANRGAEQPNQAEAEPNPVTEKENAADKARSLVVLLATLVAAVTYLAGLHPPGGIWQDNRDGHKAGDPILLSTNNVWRYKAFFYCNSVSFTASLLVVILLVHKKPLLRHRLVEAVMILVLFALIGAYVAGSSRDVWTSVVTLSMAAAILVQVVFHVVAIFITKWLRTRDHAESSNTDDELAQKTRKRLLLFTILVSTITYRTGLSPPGGFLLQDHQSGHNAGDPVLSYNFPHRYKAFITCNSLSFMLSTYILLRCLTLYRPATRRMLSVCKAAVLYGLMGAYAAGSSQHLKTSIYIFVLAPVVLFLVVPLLRVYFIITSRSARVPVTTIGNRSTASTQGAATETNTQDLDAIKKKRIHAERKYRMLLGIIVASVTYMAGLEPPGGTWQSSSGRYEAGNPIMYDNRRTRYLAFFYSNTTSFMASIVIILLLIVPKKLFGHYQQAWLRRWRGLLNVTIALDLIGLLGAYAAGSTRSIKTSVYILLFTLALTYCGIHLALASISKRSQLRRGSQV